MNVLLSQKAFGTSGNQYTVWDVRCLLVAITWAGRYNSIDCLQACTISPFRHVFGVHKTPEELNTEDTVVDLFIYLFIYLFICYLLI